MENAGRCRRRRGAKGEVGGGGPADWGVRRVGEMRQAEHGGMRILERRRYRGAKRCGWRGEAKERRVEVGREGCRGRLRILGWRLRGGEMWRRGKRKKDRRAEGA